MNDTTDRVSIDPHTVTAWVDRYLEAWRTNEPADIAGLFTDDARYRERPYETEWIGRDEIVSGWQSRWDWQQGGWEFDWELVSIEGATAVVTGVGRYAELGVFDNRWTLTFRTPELCETFVMINTERDGDGA